MPYLLLLLFFLSSVSYAQGKSKIELGVISGGQYLADYRGSKETQARALIAPFFIYRGDVFKVDRDGLRGEVFQSRRIELNVSAEAALSGGNEDNERRQGMPVLDSALEFGPSLNVNLSGVDFREGWSLRLPVRSVFTVGGHGFEYIGYVFNPKFTYVNPNLFDSWRASFNIGASYGSNKYHDYYYRVERIFETAERMSYEADNGYSGTYVKAGISRRKNDFWYGISLRYDNLNGATFEDSPLVETRDYFSVTVGFGWFLWKSKASN